MKLVPALLCFLLLIKLSYAQNPDSTRQTDLVDYIVKWFNVQNVDEKREDRDLRISLFPTQSSATNGKLVISSVNIAFVAGDKESTSTSNIYFIPYTNFKGKYGIYLYPNIWLNRDSWNIKGEYFFLRYPQYTWGLGGNTKQDVNLLTDYNYIRVNQYVLRKISGSLSAGLGYFLDYHYNVSVEQGDIYIPELDYLVGDANNSTSSGLTFPLSFDNRSNSINPKNGAYLNVTWRYNSPALGSDNEWNSLYIDARKYFSFSNQKQRILALRSFYWTKISGDIPYLDLPANGWEPAFGSTARGFEQSRYRSNALLYAESEFRFDLTRNGLWGGVIFTNFISVSDYNTQKFTYWHPAAGAGLRIKFNKYSRTNVTFDYAFSKEYNTYYISIGEAF